MGDNYAAGIECNSHKSLGQPAARYEVLAAQYSKQSVLSIFERLLTAILSKFCSLLFTLLAVSGAVWITLIQLLACSSKHVKPFGQTGIQYFRS